MRKIKKFKYIKLNDDLYVSEACGNVNGRKFACIIKKNDAQYQVTVKALDNGEIVRNVKAINLDRAKRNATKLLKEVGIKKSLINKRKKK